MSKVIQYKTIVQNIPKSVNRDYLISVEAMFYGRQFNSIWTTHSYDMHPENAIRFHKNLIRKHIRSLIESEIKEMKLQSLGTRKFTEWLNFNRK